MSIRCNGIVGLLLLFLILAGILVYAARAQDSVGTTAVAPSPLVDPNKAPSEFNHHIAGYALIGVGLLVLAGLTSPKIHAVQLVWPLLFILAGFFLAAWSDAEIWPRGNLSWTWLLHHDAEARQHKIYAVLLIALGVLEYMRNRCLLGGFWRVASFPALAILGAGLLLIHDHNGSSGTRLPEAKSYLINPALDFDGKPWSSASASDPPVPIEHADSKTDHSSMAMNGDVMSMSESNSTHHVHHMSPSMLLVQREHFWFMIVGLAIALFKFLSDVGLRNRRFVPYLWPSATVLLGVLLALYRE